MHISHINIVEHKIYPQFEYSQWIYAISTTSYKSFFVSEEKNQMHKIRNAYIRLYIL